MTSPLSLLDRIRQRLADVPQVVEKKMFGATAFLVNDKMCINATERELIAINLGYQESNGAKTEWDDIAEFLK